MSEAFATGWVRFICALVSSRSEWIKPVLERAVKGLSYSEWRSRRCDVDFLQIAAQRHSRNRTLPHTGSDWRALAFAGFSSDPLETASVAASAPTRRQIYARIHRLIRQLISLIPTLPSYLGPMLTRHLPPKRDSRTAQLVFIRNALRICEYCQELSESVLALVIGRALQIDVEIQVELDDLEEDDGASSVFMQEQVDPFDRGIHEAVDSDDSDDEDDGSDEDDDGEDDVLSDDEVLDELDVSREKQLEKIRKLVHHLDSIMRTAFDHLHGLHKHYERQANVLTNSFDQHAAAELAVSDQPSRGSNSERALYRDMRSVGEAYQARQNLFSSLLSIFSRSILPTFKSRHVQFLLFWYASLDSEYADFFVGALISKAIYDIADAHSLEDSGGAHDDDRDAPAIIRVAAASYVASLVSRAKYIDGDMCRAVVHNFCAFLEGHLQRYADPSNPLSAAAPGTDPHSIFYSAAQATFYIFCFRWRDLTAAAAAGKKTHSGAGGGATSGLSQSFASSDGGFGVSPAFSSVSQGGASDSDTSAAGASGFGAGMAMGEGWACNLSILVRAITSNLNPLRYCSPAIVNQFAIVAQHCGFFYCFSIIDANKRSAKNEDVMNALRESHSGAATPTTESPQRSTQQAARTTTRGPETTVALVASFFPFDPYRLKTSSDYVDDIYREWAEVAPEDLADEEDEDDSEEEEMDDSDMSSSMDSRQASGALAVPGAGGRARHGRPTKNGHSYSSSSGVTHATGTSASSSEAQSSVAQSFEAMSISPFKH